MTDNFDNCLKHLLVHEAGFVNHPSDPGGMTNLGVTAKVWAEWTGHDVNEKIMRNLTPADVAPLYRKKYWNACRADELVSGLDYAVFDCAVNSGVGRAIKLLQKCVGVPADGGFGPTTYAAVAQFKGGTSKKLVEDYCNERLEFLTSLLTFGTFGRGWTRRVNEVKNEALRM
jgi:lysozyme family protein